jgi:signal transduction histidine kinase
MSRTGGRLRLAATLLVVAALVTLAIGALISRALPEYDAPTDDPISLTWSQAVFVLAFTVSGLIVAQERPRNPIGWLLIVSGWCAALSFTLGLYGVSALVAEERGWPFGLAAIWAAGFLWFPALVLPFSVLPQVYPDGEPVSTDRRWRWPLRGALSGTVLITAVLAAAPENPDDWIAGLEAPWVLPSWLAPLGGVLVGLGFLGIASGFVAGLIGLAVRFRRGTPEVRGQIGWLALPLLIAPIPAFTSLQESLIGIVLPLIAVAIAIGVVGYGLLDISLPLRRALVFLPLTVLIALLIGAVTAVIGQAAGDSGLGIVVAAIIIAVAVLPVRDLLLRIVDRALYGERSDPLAVVDRFGSAAATTPTGIVDAVAAAVGAPAVALLTPDGSVRAAIGDVDAARERFPLLADGEPIATLAVAPRRGERVLDPADRRLLVALAPHVAATLRSRDLADSLRREQERLLTAVDSERDRLRRDLHDGLGPSLSGIALGLEAAEGLLESEPRRAAQLVQRSRAETALATAEVRRVIDGLRPAGLAAGDLPAAVRSLADRAAPAVATEVAGEPGELPVEVESALYRITAEALTNVARHAAATRCQVALTRTAAQVTVTITDDGRGINGTAPGVGLTSMRHRAAALGGSLAVLPADGGGTVVQATVPLGGAP